MIRARLRAWGPNLVLLIGSVLMCFAMVEIGLRVYYGNPAVFRDPQVRHVPTSYGYKPEPLQRDTFTTDKPSLTNAQGFRDTEDWVVPKPVGQKRVMLLGDSLTFGNAVALEDLFATRLEAGLKVTDPRVEVLNASAGGWSTETEIGFFETEGTAFEPDVLVVGFYPNDFVSPPPPGRPREPWRPQLTAEARVEGRPPWLQWLPYSTIFTLKRSATVAYLRDRLAVINAGPDFIARVFANDVDLDTHPVVQYTYAELARLKRLCDARGIRMVLAFIPPVNYFWVPRGSVSFPQHMRVFAEGAGMTFVDLSEGMWDAPASPALYMYPWDNHLSPAGHARVADQLVPVVARALEGHTAGTEPGQSR